MTSKFNITGMSCAACQAHVEKAVGKLPGVSEVSVSLLTNSMTVQGHATDAEIIKAVYDAGYGAVRTGVSVSSDTDMASLSRSETDMLKDRETPELVRRLCFSVVILAVIVYWGMGHMIFMLPIPLILDNPAAIGLMEMLLTLIVMFINRNFFISGTKAIRHGSANMDTLIAIGSGAAFLYSVAALFLILNELGQGDMKQAIYLSSHHFYFESAAMILTLITIGKTLEAYSKGRTTDALKALMRLTPETANIEREGKVIETPVSEVRIDDIFIVKPGESIPVDGVIISGSTAVNEAALTGESMPVDRQPGETVLTGTINISGYIKARAVKIGADTTLAGIIKLVSDASATKAPIGRIADKVSGIFCPAVIIIAALTFTGWLIAGRPFDTALARAVSVLVISCPCALGLATPVAIMVGSGVGARNGILFKTAAALEEAGRTDIMVLDKTGTVTRGEPSVTDVIPADGISSEHLLYIAASLESKSEHPLSKAVVDHTEKKGISISEVSAFSVIPGKGLTAKLDGYEINGGNYEYIADKTLVDKDLKSKADQLSSSGSTPIYFAEGNKTLGIIGAADTLKDESLDAISRLKNMGIKVIMLTGDNRRTAAAIGSKAGVDKVIAGVLPDGKEKIIRTLKTICKVTMTGDGINDAPALTSADVGMAIGAGTDVAIDAADIVLVKSRLTDVPAAISLSRATIKNIRENLFWAFFYNIICIPLAIGLYQALFHWDFEMNPMIGALAMSLSSVTVCLNALRLNFFRLYDRSVDRRQNLTDYDLDNILKEANMTKTITIEGMMCGHCEKTVKNALEALSGISSASVSHKDGTAVVELSSEVTDDILKEAVEAKDYKVTAIV